MQRSLAGETTAVPAFSSMHVSLIYMLDRAGPPVRSAGEACHCRCRLCATATTSPSARLVPSSLVASW